MNKTEELCLSRLGYNMSNSLGVNNLVSSKNDMEFNRVITPKILLPTKKSSTKITVNNENIIDILFHGKSFIKVSSNNPFIWDGSYLGRICNENIIDIFSHSGIKYWKLNIYGHERICMIRLITNGTASICDEMKEYFGQSKLGTHRIKHNTKLYLLIEARLDPQGRVIEEITIDNIYSSRSQDFKRRAREVFVFRDIFGLSMTREKSIVVRWSDKSYIPPYPVSFTENEMQFKEDIDVITIASEKKWFDGIDINDVFKSMLKVESESDISERVSYIRNKLEQTIERIDRDLIWIVQPVMEKLIRRLVSGFSSGGSPTPDWE